MLVSSPSQAAPPASPACPAPPGRPAPTSSPCPLCGQSEREILSRRDRRGKPLATAICPRCGLVSHNVIPTDEALRDYYASQYRLEYHHESTPSARRVMRAWRQGARLLKLLREYVKPGAAVMEIGAGIGATVKAFELAGFDARGIEPGAGFQTFSHDKLHAPVERATLDEIPTATNADLVLLVHVIEHLRDPAWALGRIRELMNENGLLYIECPNLQAPFARPSRLFHQAHIFNFTGATLEAFAHRAGLETARRFGGDGDPNLAFLFSRGETTGSLDSSNYESTLASLKRYNVVTYHLRLRYLSTRMKKLSWSVLEHTLAPLVVKRIQRRCGQTQSSEGEHPCRTE